MNLDDNNGGFALLPKVSDNIYSNIDILGGRSMNPAQTQNINWRSITTHDRCIGRGIRV